MSFNIVDLVKDQISDQLMGTMGNVLGTDSTQTSSALSGALPALLGGLSKSAESPAGASALFDSIQKQDDGLLGNVGALLGGNKASELTDQGGSILTSLLGGGALGKIADVVSSFAGISKGNSSSLMGMLAPIVLGALKKKVSADGMNASSVASLLSGQKNNINAAMPHGFADKLNSAGVFDSVNVAQAATATPSATTPDPVVQHQTASSGGKGIFRWVLPVIGLLVAAVLGMQFFGGDKAEDTVATTQDAVSGAADSATNAASDAATAASAKALEAAQEAMPEGVDLGEISNNLNGAFSSATDSLSGITDVDSATAALPAIEEVTGKLGGLSDVITRLPDAAKGPIGGIVETGLATLQPLIEKVSAIPGVGSIIEPVITPLMAMLEGLKG